MTKERIKLISALCPPVPRDPLTSIIALTLVRFALPPVPAARAAAPASPTASSPALVAIMPQIENKRVGR